MVLQIFHANLALFLFTIKKQLPQTLKKYLLQSKDILKSNSWNGTRLNLHYPACRLHPMGLISERSGFGRFGQRLSSIRRKAEKLKLGNTTPGSGLRPALAQANLSYILPSPLTGREGNHIKSLEYASTHLVPPVLLRKVKSEYKIDENRRKFLSAR